MAISPLITSPGVTELEGAGSFVVGSVAFLFFTFTDVTGELYDPTDIDVSIKDPAGVEVEMFTETDKMALGKFAIGWMIPTTADTGNYTLDVSFTYETPTGPAAGTFSEHFLVLDATANVITLRRTVWRSYLELLLGNSQRIPVFHEPARLNATRNIAKLTYPGGVKSGPWNQAAGVEVLVNNIERTSGFNVDYLNGTISFDNALDQHDQVLVSYNFRWFRDEELNMLIRRSIDLFNNWPPHSAYTIASIPERYGIAVFWGAAVDALRRWLMDMQFQEPNKIFGSLERAQTIFGQMDTLKKDYEEWLEKILEQKKLQPYVGLTKTVTVPEFTLPGGRSRWFRYLFKGG